MSYRSEINLNSSAKSGFGRLIIASSLFSSICINCSEIPSSVKTSNPLEKNPLKWRFLLNELIDLTNFGITMSSVRHTL